MEKQELRKKLNDDFVAPLLADYVKWVLTEATARNIKTLYFLARDGYLLLEIASRFCRKYQIDIDCRYLYCSRTSLRMPSYHLIGDEAMELLLLGGNNVTPRHLLERARLDEQEQQDVWADCGLSVDEDALLCKRELEDYRVILKSSHVYQKLICEKSRREYIPTLSYFRQEGLLTAKTIAIVDSGWTGSMQRSLRQLLESAGFRGNIIGFYFGMFSDPRDSKDGTYLTYFFDASHEKWNKVHFNNNLFECLLSAPHGMTVCYAYDEYGISHPQIKPPSGSEEGILQFTNEVIDAVMRSEQPYTKFVWDERTAKDRAAKLVNRYMMHPTRAEAEILGAYYFCDDVTEGYYNHLADERQALQLNGYLILPRIKRKLLRQTKESIAPELYWPCGSIAFLPIGKRWWYRLNICVWEWMKYTKREVGEFNVYG